MKPNKPDFIDFKINTKIKLSALWASVTLCYLYGDYFELYVPGKTEGLISNDNLLDTPTKLFGATLLLAIPAVMVFLSVFLKPKINRILNMVLGLVFTVIMLSIASTSFTPWRAFYAFLAFVESAITVLIIFSAWNWERQA